MPAARLVVDLGERILHGRTVDDRELAYDGCGIGLVGLDQSDDVVRDAAQEQVPALAADVGRCGHHVPWQFLLQ